MADSVEKRVYRPRIDTLTPVDPEFLRRTLEIETSIDRIDPGSLSHTRLNEDIPDEHSARGDKVVIESILPPDYPSQRVIRIERSPRATEGTPPPSIELVPFVATADEVPPERSV